jgi:hypothetical protein
VESFHSPMLSDLQRGVPGQPALPEPYGDYLYLLSLLFPHRNFSITVGRRESALVSMHGVAWQHAR